MNPLKQIQDAGVIAARPTTYRFDIIKGIEDSTGRLSRARSVGSAYLVEGRKTYTIYLRSFVNDVFYLLPDKEQPTSKFAILTRTHSRRQDRKFFWNVVGIGTVLDGSRSGYMQLRWDLLDAKDIYMNLHPQVVYSSSEQADAKGADAQ